ncbi:hypothetical protein M8J77_020680 [Diaphorina citri]|nr:hypothetical protein M8J77_020680 [Diaphorina citri]
MPSAKCRQQIAIIELPSANCYQQMPSANRHQKIAVSKISSANCRQQIAISKIILPDVLNFDNYKFGHGFSTSLAMPRDKLAGFRSEATEFS